MADSKFGVITEQGFPLGQFGFNGVKKDDQRKLQESAKKDNTHPKK